jgi:hypothetical protein
MSLVFFPLLAGHLIADFWLQPGSWVLHKKENGIKSFKLVLHASIASILPVVFTFQLNLWWFVPVIFATHFIIDYFKSKFEDNIPVFLADQILHVIVLLVLVSIVTNGQMNLNVVNFWIYTTGFVFVTNPAGIVIGKFLKIVIPDKNNPAKMDASGWIGVLERTLIVIFVTTNQFSAIGFLIAAKSVFRFGEVKEGGNKKAEYFLLGTLVSFTLAIIVGLGILKLKELLY